MPSSLRPALLAFGLPVLLALPTTAADPQPTTFKPDPASVQRFGPAYRYPQAGWIVLHIEGDPYERGYQHGRLLAPEIEDYVSALARLRSPRAPADSWRAIRMLVDALFLRRYDTEFLDEMKGIADGAAAAGAKFDDRPLDLLDIAAANSEMETGSLEGALEATATGLEGKRFADPPYARTRPEAADHCSAFAATGPATADGKIVFGHITMFGLYMVRHFNVWLDVKPSAGHRVLMQSYPGGIQSGMDYYLNDAGLLVTETTLSQTRFDGSGDPLAGRIRRVLQYADSIDDAVKILDKANNGLYTNEWLLGDINTNEIAMFELGTHKTRLWRSSKDQWFGGTAGFYWGCNNAKDLEVRLETVASVEGEPANVVFHASDRDRKWLSLYEKHKGKIAPGFGFEAFTTPPLAAFPSCDAKFTTTAMARELKTWALFGPPLGRTWDASETERRRYSDIRPLVSNDWTVLGPDAPAPPSAGTPAAVDLAAKQLEPPRDDTPKVVSYFEDPNAALNLTPAWHGTLLPRADSDLWLAAAFADYERIVARERARNAKARNGKLSESDRDQSELALFAPRARYHGAVRRLGHDIALTEIKPDLKSDAWYGIAAGKGVLLLAALREVMGVEVFARFMDDFGRAHAGKPAATDEFFAAARNAHGKSLDEFSRNWLGRGLPAGQAGGPAWSIDTFDEDPEHTLIVYGTVKEAHAQREAAEYLQSQIARRWGNFRPPIQADADVNDADLAGHHVLLVGRPDSNSIARRFASGLPVAFGPASFRVRGETYAHARTAVAAAGPNPLDERYSTVVFAGLSAEATWSSVRRLYDRGSPAAPVVLLPAGARPKAIPVTEREKAPEVASDRTAGH
jgi:hypothetical protein